jgi:hypothetical protein
LFDAVVLSTSATVTQVAEAFAMPESAVRFSVGADAVPTRTAAQLLASTVSLASVIPASLSAPAVTPQQTVPQQVSDTAALVSLTGLSLLQQLALLQPQALSDFVAGNPEVVQQLLDSPPVAREVQLWWSGLGISARSGLMTSAPQLVGNLEGVPYSLRDYTNRSFLASSIDALGTTSGGRSQEIDAGNRLRMLQKVSQALVTEPGTAPRSLLSLDTAGSGTAAIVIGDVAAADVVTVLVPGMFYSVDGQVAAWATAAQNVYDEQREWVDRTPSLTGATVATVAWIGYEAPSLVNFITLDLAYTGRDALARTVDGLHELRGADQPYLSIVAHSYGSTATMMALTDLGMQVDSVTLIGSPGSAAQQVSDLGVPGDNVYVGEAAWDQVKDSAFFGSDPGSASFGARHFSVDGGIDPVTGRSLAASTGHDAYLAAGSESLRNIALIALGQGSRVTTDGSSPAVKTATAYRTAPR